MLKFVVVLTTIVPLSATLNQFLQTLRDNVSRESCNVKITPNTQLQEICGSAFSSLKSECFEGGYELRKLHKVQDFRRQIICNGINETFANILKERTTSSEPGNIIESVRIKRRLENDMLVKLDELAAIKTQETLNQIRLEAEETTAKVEKHLAELEQNYLRELLNLIREGLRQDPVSHPPRESPEHTTYLPHQAANTEVSNGKILFTFWFSSSPPLGQDGEDVRAEWMCTLPRNWMYEIVKNKNRPDLHDSSKSEPYQLAYRQGYILTTRTTRVDAVKMEDHFGARLDSTSFVLAISFLHCQDTEGVESKGEDTWGWLTYKGVQFNYDERGWLRMEYTDVSKLDPDLEDPLAEDKNEPENGEVYLVSALRSEAKPHDCANEVLGPGIYRMFGNGTCKGIPLFSKRAAQVEGRCTDQMVPGLELEEVWVLLSLESWYQECMGVLSSTDIPIATEPIPVDPQHVDPYPVFAQPMHRGEEDEPELERHRRDPLLPASTT